MRLRQSLTLLLLILLGANPSVASEAPGLIVQAALGGVSTYPTTPAKRQPAVKFGAPRAYTSKGVVRDGRPGGSYAARLTDKRPSKWCGWYMRQKLGVASEAYNVARNWLSYGQPTAPQVGAVVVWPHHVGLIVGRDNKGWLVESGNYRNRVAVHRIYGRPIGYRTYRA